MTHQIDPTPLNGPKEQATAKSLAQHCVAIGQPRDGEGVPEVEYTLALLLWRAIKQIEALTLIADPMAQRFGAAAGHKYPELVAAGMGHYWQGPKLNDWHPDLLEGIRKHLRGLERASHKGACCDYIRNRLHDGPAGLGALELRFEEGGQGAGEQGSKGVGERGSLTEAKEPPIKTLAELSESEREAHHERMAVLRTHMPELTRQPLQGGGDG